MSRFTTIAVGIDFSPCSAIALAQAVRIARWSSAQVHPIHVIDTLVAIELEEALTPLQSSIRDGLIADAERAWRDFCATIPDFGQLPLKVTINNRVTGILERAEQVHADLLVLGAFGTKAPDVGMGTVATACVRRAKADVLLVRDTQAGPFRKVIAGVDFSSTSYRAVERAAHIAAKDDAELVLLHVFTGPWHVLHYRSPTVEVAAHFQMQYRDGLERRLIEFCRPALEAAGATRVQHVLFDHQGHRSGIVEYAANNSADLLVVGTRGRSNLRDLFLGSTAEKTLRDSVCSVFAVKPAESSSARA